MAVIIHIIAVIFIIAFILIIITFTTIIIGVTDAIFAYIFYFFIVIIIIIYPCAITIIRINVIVFTQLIICSNNYMTIFTRVNYFIRIFFNA